MFMINKGTEKFEPSSCLFSTYYKKNFETARRDAELKMNDEEPKFFTNLVEVILSRPRFEPQIKFFRWSNLIR